MNKHFAQALEDGLIEPVSNFNGGEFIVNNSHGKPIKYYQSSNDGISMLMGRFHSFGDLLRMHDSLKISDDLLSTTLQSMFDMQNRALVQMSIDPQQTLDAIRETMTAIERLQQRRAFGKDITQLYDIASIFYFSEDENPGYADTQINRLKISDWLRADNKADITLFFSTTAIEKFIPLKMLLETDSLIYFQNQNQLEILDLTRTLFLSKRFGLTTDTISTIESRRETLYEYDGLTNQLLSRTTNS